MRIVAFLISAHWDQRQLTVPQADINTLVLVLILHIVLVRQISWSKLQINNLILLLVILLLDLNITLRLVRIATILSVPRLLGLPPESTGPHGRPRIVIVVDVVVLEVGIVD